MFDLRVLVQSTGDLDVGKISSFVSSIPEAKLVVFHCSVNDDAVLENFEKSIAGKLSVPLVGVRVSASLTNTGFYEDSVVVGVFSGDFDVKVFHDELVFENSEKVIESIASKLPKNGLCLAYAACYYTDGSRLDYILRNIAIKRPALQFSGLISSPKPMVFSMNGPLKNSLVYVVFQGVDLTNKFVSGFELDEKGQEFTVTKSDDFHILEIDNKNAVSLYCGLKHVRPYMVNALTNQLNKPSVHKIIKLLSDASGDMYETIMKTAIEILGTLKSDGFVEPIPMQMADELRSRWTSHCYVFVGTKLRWIRYDPDKLIDQYTVVEKKLVGASAIFSHECVFRLFYMNFRVKDIERKVSKFKVPLMLSYGYGEIGAYIPYTDKNVNMVHGGIIQVLGFK